MQTVWFLLLALGLPALVYYLLVRPRDPQLAEDFVPFPMILRAAGGIRQYPGFLLLGAVANTPILLLTLNAGTVSHVEVFGVGLLWFGLGMPLLLQGAVAYGALRPLRRKRITTSAILRHGLVGFIPALMTTYLLGVLIAIPIVIGYLITPKVAGDPVAPGSMVIGFSSAAVAAVVASALYLAPAVGSDRHRGPFGAMAESLAVTFGYRLRIVGIVLFFAIVHLLLLGTTLSILAADAKNVRSTEVFVLVAYPVGTLVGTWHALTAVVVYHRLRKLKYGGEVDGLVEVFE